MQKYLGLAKHFLLLTATAIASSLITAKPSQAATLASSVAGFKLENFSISPKDVETFTNTNTQAVSFNGQGQVNADAIANANFTTIPDLSKPFANNISLSQATGQGKNYFGIAESDASVTGYNFQVAPGSTFSFDFMGFLSLETSIDNRKLEYAGANGLIKVLLYDQENGSLLDSLSIQGDIAVPSNKDSFTYNKSENFSLIPRNTSFNSSLTGIDKYVRADIKGYYSRKFAQGANVRLFELKSNRATVVVPEPNSNFALIFGTAAIIVIAKAKRSFR